MSSNYNDYQDLPPLDGQHDGDRRARPQPADPRPQSARPWPPVPPAGGYIPGGQPDPWSNSTAGGSADLNPYTSGHTGQYNAVSDQTGSWAAVSASIERSLPSSGTVDYAPQKDPDAAAAWADDGDLVESCKHEYDRITHELDELRVLLTQSSKEVEKLNHRKVLTAAQVRDMEEHLELHPRKEISERYLAAAEAEMRAFMISEQREQLQAKVHTFEQYARFLLRVIQVLQAPPPVTQPMPPMPASPSSLWREPGVASPGEPRASAVSAWPDLPELPTTALVNPAASSIVSLSAVMPALNGQLDAVSRIIQAQESIRERIAQRLHDGPTQSLANVVLTAEVCEKLVQSEPRRALSELGNLKVLVNAALQETRKFIFDLRPMTLDDLGLVATLRRHSADMAARFQVQIPLSAPQGERRMPKEAEVAVFRVAQEAILNAVTHSRATVIQVMAAWPQDGFVLVVEDNGSGFNVEQALTRTVNRQTIGIASMQERAEMLGGWLKIESSPGHGTRIELSVPEPEMQASKTFGVMQRY